MLDAVLVDIALQQRVRVPNVGRVQRHLLSEEIQPYGESCQGEAPSIMWCLQYGCQQVFLYVLIVNSEMFGYIVESPEDCYCFRQQQSESSRIYRADCCQSIKQTTQLQHVEFSIFRRTLVTRYVRRTLRSTTAEIWPRKGQKAAITGTFPVY